MDIIFAAFLGYVIGAAGRTLYDYLFKIVENPDLAFDRRYLVTMLVSIILSVLTATVTFSTVPIPDTSWNLVVFFMATMGFTINDLINKPLSYAIKLMEKVKAKANGTE